MESVGPNWRAGSRFWFEAPLRLVAQPRPAPTPEPRRVVGYTRSQGSGAFKILLADDSPANRKVLQEFLLLLGFELTQAENGAEAIAQATQLNPDLIIMDLVMPQLDGLAATRQIRQLPALQATPIVAFSASVGHETHLESLSAGCDAFLAKPFETEQVLDTLQRYLPLAWLYAEPASPSTVAAQAPAMVLPSPAELRALLPLTMVGDVTGIEERASALKKTDPRYAPFTALLHHLAADFKIDELEQFI